ncbi:MAG: hypothetical protein KAI83_04835 [Thiomargarita sp.]|nr:hypothetical protein [Thiomargarita sp.]
MTVLRDNLTACIQAFQELLNEHQNDKALVEAAKEKWDDEDDNRRQLVIACQADNMRLASDTGRPSSDDDENTLTNRNPFGNSALK